MISGFSIAVMRHVSLLVETVGIRLKDARIQSKKRQGVD